MKSRASQIDLGLVSMAVGEARQAPSQPENIDMRVNDIARLDAILSGGSGQLQGQHDLGQQAQTDSLLPSNSEPSNDELTRLAGTIAKFWTGDGSRSLREVRAQLPPDILPATWLRVYEQGGVLQIELSCGAQHEREWLAQELDSLAARLGRRLKRPLFLCLFDEQGHNCGSVLWNKGETA